MVMKKYPSLKPIVIQVQSSDTAALQRAAAQLEKDLRENFQILNELLRNTGSGESAGGISVSQDATTQMLILS